MAYSTIPKPSVHFNTKLYTGNGGTNAQTGIGFQPDFTWIKSRSDALSHALFDAVRGTTKVLNSNATTAEYTNTDTLTAFGTDGFTVGSNTGVNANGQTRVAWNWKAGGGQGSSNTDGSINTTYTSVNTTAGFSIIKFTGTGANATVGHGLGAVPKFIFGKNTNVGSSAWPVYSSVLGGTKYVNINTTSGEGTFSGYWNNTNPTSSLISIGSHGDVNGVGDNMIYYCFAEKTGYSKFGSYVGNGNADGAFIYTGFKPSFVLQKNYTSGSANDWTLADNKRPGYNVINDRLCPNTTAGTAQNNKVDFLSNGFKCRQDQSNANGNGQTYIYMAFAEEPLVANSGTGGVPATAR